MAIQIDGDSGVSGVNGSATTPALQGTDSNTGIVFGTDTVQVATGGSTRATVDSSGRLLVGTSSAIDTYPVFQVKGYTGGSTGAGWMAICSGASTPANNENMGLFSYLNAGGGEAARIECEADAAHTGSSAQGRLAFMTTASGDTSPTERMRLDSLGRLMLGTTTEGNGIADTLTIAESGTSGITIRSGTSSEGNLAFSDGTSGADEYRGLIRYDHDLNFMSFWSNAAEAMRITGSGNIFFGTTSQITSGKISVEFNGTTHNGVVYKTTRTAVGTDFAVYVNSSGSVAGKITHNGSTTVSYTTSSDYRLKENVVAIADGITRVKQLAPKRFNFIEDGADRVVDGFLAHEAQAVVPEAVTGTHNEVDEDDNPVYQGIDQSKLVPLLTAALQEAIGKIETLETQNADLLARVTALEAA